MTADQILAKLPPAAIADYEEFEPGTDKVAGLKRDVAKILTQEINVDQTLAKTPSDVALVDDRPLNEYFLMRAVFGDDFLRH